MHVQRTEYKPFNFFGHLPAGQLECMHDNVRFTSSNSTPTSHGLKDENDIIVCVVAGRLIADRQRGGMEAWNTAETSRLLNDYEAAPPIKAHATRVASSIYYLTSLAIAAEAQCVRS
jgi:hypothetical protein